MSKILIIDGEGGVVDLLKVVLARAGHEVLTPADAISGLESYKRERPNLVLLDRDLPKMAGLQVMRVIKEREPQAKIIVLNRTADPEREVQYRRLGASIFMDKAAGVDTLLKVVERSLRSEPGAGGDDWNADSVVLVIDDDAGVRQVLKRFLVGKGYRVTAVASGQEAMSLVRSDWPHVILLDVNMPKMHGVKALQAIRRINAQVPVMMISGQEDMETVGDCLRLGAFDYVLKPLDLHYLEISIWGKLLCTLA